MILDDLRSHDWYHEYSDDTRVFLAGRAAKKTLEARLKAARCPFEWWHINYAIFNRILERHTIVKDGNYYDPNWKYNYVPRRRSELITQEEADQIMAWLNAHPNI